MSLNGPELHQLGKRENDRNAPEVTAGEPCSAGVLQVSFTSLTQVVLSSPLSYLY